MKTATDPSSKTPFAKALKSFMGYLEGTEKAAHTIKSYRLDLLAFQDFFEGEKGKGSPRMRLEDLDLSDLERFHDYLKTQGLKTNTRRRKLLTVRRFLVFLVNRNKLPDELGKKVPTPHKVERVPLTVSSEQLLTAIRALPADLLLDERNRAMLWVLAETGCQVSEVAGLRYDQWGTRSSQARLEIRGKAAREIPVSLDLYDAIQSLRARSGGSEWVFLGFNKFGALGGAISSRGVELLVRHLAPVLGHPELTPRTFRHSVVVEWFKQGVSREEIQKRLGLKTAYAFRAYEPLFAQLRPRI